MALHHNLGSEELELINNFVENHKDKNILTVFDIGTNRGLFVDLLIEKNIHHLTLLTNMLRHYHILDKLI